MKALKENSSCLYFNNCLNSAKNKINFISGKLQQKSQILFQTSRGTGGKVLFFPIFAICELQQVVHENTRAADIFRSTIDAIDFEFLNLGQ